MRLSSNDSAVVLLCLALVEIELWKRRRMEARCCRSAISSMPGGGDRIMKAWNVGGGISTMQDHICVSPGIFNNNASKVSRISRFQNRQLDSRPSSLSRPCLPHFWPLMIECIMFRSEFADDSCAICFSSKVMVSIDCRGADEVKNTLAQERLRVPVSIRFRQRRRDSQVHKPHTNSLHIEMTIIYT